MKELLIFLTITLFSFNANAVTIEQKYIHCKPYQNNGFSFENLSQSQINNTLQCLSYLAGIRDRGHANCLVMKTVNKKNILKKTRLKTLSFLTANADVNIDTLVTSFINYAENTTESWKEPVWGHTAQFISNKFPCKID